MKILAAKAFSSNTYLGQQVSFSDKDKPACKGQNSCKGKGGCTTDGSKPPSV